jgi:hypothetical protein
MMMMPGRRAMMVYAIEHDVAGRSAKRLSLPDRFLVDPAVHDDHY